MKRILLLYFILFISAMGEVKKVSDLTRVTGPTGSWLVITSDPAGTLEPKAITLDNLKLWIGGVSGTGTVTSVALTAPAILSVSGSPVTTTGTLALSLASQSANRVWAGPAAGSAAAPTFRALAAADIPDLSGSYLTPSGDGSSLTGITAAQVGASATGHTHTFASLTSKPTTLSGYGISDAVGTADIGSTVQGYSASTTTLGNTTTGTGAIVRAAGATLTTASVNGVTLSGSGTLTTTGGTLGTAAFTATTAYDAAGAATTAQAAAVQRANHTGTQSADTLTDGTTNKAFLATERTKLAAISGTNTGDQDLSGLVVKASNLSDLASASTARTNLGLGSIATLTTAALAPSFSSLTDGSTITLTCDATKGVQNAKVTLGGNRTLAIASSSSGMTGVLIVTQDGTGSRTLTLPAGSKVIGGGSGAVTLTTTAGAVDILTWVYDGTSYFWTLGKGFN